MNPCNGLNPCILARGAKLGDLLAAIEPKRDKESSSKRTSLASLPPGISKKESHQAQTITHIYRVLKKCIGWYGQGGIVDSEGI